MSPWFDYSWLLFWLICGIFGNPQAIGIIVFNASYQIHSWLAATYIRTDHIRRFIRVLCVENKIAIYSIYDHHRTSSIILHPCRCYFETEFWAPTISFSYGAPNPRSWLPKKPWFIKIKVSHKLYKRPWLWSIVELNLLHYMFNQ